MAKKAGLGEDFDDFAAEEDEDADCGESDESQEEAVFGHGCATLFLGGSDCVLEADHQCSGHWFVLQWLAHAVPRVTKN